MLDPEYSILLNKVYDRLADDPDDQLKGIEMHHSTIYYIKSHLNDKAKDPDCAFYGREFTTKEVYEILLDEDMLEDEMKLPKDRN